MTTWNYRLTVQTGADEELWAVRELYYDDAGNVVNWSQDPQYPLGGSWQEFSDDLARMSAAVELPAYDLDAGGPCDRQRQPTGADSYVARQCPKGWTGPHSHCPHLDCPDCPGACRENP